MNRTGQGSPESEATIRQTLYEILARRLLEGGALVEAMHLILAAVVLVLIWGSAPRLHELAWVGGVGISALARGAVRRHLASTGAGPDRILTAMRIAVLVNGLAWGLGALFVGAGLPIQDLALVMVVLSGLAAAGTVSLTGDPPAFYGFFAALFIPLAARLAVGEDRWHIVGLVLVALYGVTLTVFYRRTHATLAGEIRGSLLLQASQQDVVRERAFLDALIRSAPNAIVAVDFARQGQRINRGFERLFGYTAEEVVGHTVDDLIIPESERAAVAELRRRAALGEAVTAEGVRRHKDGHLIAVSITAARTEGIDPGGYFVMYDDITERLRSEKALRESEERFRQLADNTHDVFHITTSDTGQHLYISPAFDRVWGFPRERLQENPRAFLDALVPEDLPELMGAIERAHRGEDADSRYRVRRPDGEVRWIEDHAMGVRDAAGQVSRIVGVARDVTGTMAAHEAERRAREAAEQATAAKTAFLANMSHEIRTPMSGILGTIELLRDTPLTPEQQRSLDVISDSGDALLRIINDILDLSKIEAGQFTLENIPFDLTKTIDGGLQLLAGRAFECGIELVCDVQAGVPTFVWGDPGRLRQILLNLVGNALKFTERGEVVVRATLVRRTAGKAEIEFVVRDTGIGISSEQLARIFQPFGQGDASTTRRYGGTGLGLSISRRLVGMMGGEITVQSEVGKGSTFTFNVALPIEAETASVAANRRKGDLRGLRTLLVDDNPTNRTVLGLSLAQAGAEVGQAASADGAIAALREAHRLGNPYRLLVSDVHMPGRDGFDLVRAVRTDPLVADILIMLLTSGGQFGDGERCRDLEVGAYLHKPVSRADLLQAALAVTGTSPGDSVPQLVTRHTIEATRRSLRVLLAEDNPVNRQMTAAMLRKRGHQVSLAENGRLAVDAVRREDFDVALMDMQMPELDGLAATREIRRFLSGRPLPIIALTANVMSGEREQCLAEGMNGYLAKPFKAHELFAAIEGWSGVTDAGPSPETTLAPAVDLDGFRASLREGGVEEMLEEIVRQFQHDAPGRLAALDLAVEQHDATAINRAAHAFKSAAGTIRAGRLQRALSVMEAAGRAGKLESAVSLLEAVREEHEVAARYLSHAVDGNAHVQT